MLFYSYNRKRLSFYMTYTLIFIILTLPYMGRYRIDHFIMPFLLLYSLKYLINYKFVVSLFYYFLLIFVIFVSTIVNFNDSTNLAKLAAFEAFIRIPLLLIIFSNIRIGFQSFRRIIRLILFISIFLHFYAYIQFFYPEYSYVIDKVYGFQLKTVTGLSVLEGALQLHRSVSVFLSPAPYGLYCAIIILLVLFTQKEIAYPKFKYFIIILSIFGGIVSQSKTFIFSMMFIIVIFAIETKNKIITYCAIGIIILGIYGAINFIHFPFYDNLMHTVQSIDTIINRPLQAIESGRYSNRDGFLFEHQYPIFSDHFIIGGGYRSHDVFADSLYFPILAMGGIIGFSLFLLFIISFYKDICKKINMYQSFKMGKFLKYSYILMLFVGIGIPSFFVERVSDTFWIVAGLTMNSNVLKYFDQGRNI